MPQCPTCKAQYEIGQRYCETCESYLLNPEEGDYFCPQCGIRVAPQQEVCHKCNAALGDTAPAAGPLDPPGARPAGARTTPFPGGTGPSAPRAAPVGAGGPDRRGLHYFDPPGGHLHPAEPEGSPGGGDPVSPGGGDAPSAGHSNAAPPSRGAFNSGGDHPPPSRRLPRRPPRRPRLPPGRSP
jgi:hypothetical protein